MEPAGLSRQIAVSGLPGRLPESPRIARPRPWSWLLLPLLLLLILPVLVICASVLQPGGGGTWRHLWHTVLAGYIWNSLGLALGVALGTAILGVFPAWLTSMFRFPGSRAWAALLPLPLALPAYIATYAYTGLLGVAGPVQSWLQAWWDLRLPGAGPLPAAVAVLSLVLYPYVYLLCRAAFLLQSGCALEAARTLRCGGASAFLRVGLPLARPALVAGVSLAMMEALADYGTVQYLGLPVFTTGIFRAWNGMGDSLAACQLSAVLLLLVAVPLFCERRQRRRARYHYAAGGYRPPPVMRLGGVRGWGACCACALPALFGFFVPCAVLLDWAAQAAAETAPGFFGSLANSLWLATAAALLASALALILRYGMGAGRADAWRGRMLEVARLGYAIPGTVIAIGVLILSLWLDRLLGFGWTWLRGDLPGLLLTGSVAGLVFAYLARFLALALSAVESGLARIRPSLGEAGRSMGLSSRQVLLRIHAPIMRNSMAISLLLVFVEVLKELPATLLLRPFDFNTLAVRTYELANEERLAEAALPALVIVAVGAVPVLLLGRFVARWHNDPVAAA
ncbi:MAG: iron ABC transporter permease [Gammaproteobacteria bacterium]|nr:iron ABC transporter permease [Gammaproteobacteria bacterium]